MMRMMIDDDDDLPLCPPVVFVAGFFARRLCLPLRLHRYDAAALHQLQTQVGCTFAVESHGLQSLQHICKTIY